MRLALHIFSKDTRYLRYEIIVSIFVTLFMCWLNGRQDGWESGIPGSLYRLANLMVPVAVLTWILLAIRVIQTDALPGSDHDWLTRPVPRFSLVLGKSLFLSAYILVPLATGAWIMQTGRGLNPFTHTPALLWYLLASVGLILLPAAAVGSIIRGLPAAVLVAVGVFTAVGSSEEILPFAVKNWSVLIWIPLAAVGFLAVVGATFVLVLQYRWRATAPARILAAAFAAVALVAQAAIPWDAGFALQRLVTPGAIASLSAKVELEPLPSYAELYETRTPLEKRVFFALKLVGLPEGHRSRIVRMSGSFVTSHGRTPILWTPPALDRERREDTRTYYVPASRLSAGDVALDGTVWFEVLAPGKKSDIPAGRRVDAPFGRCNLEIGDRPDGTVLNLVACLSSFRPPSEYTFSFRMPDYNTEPIVLSGTEAASPFPASLGLPLHHSWARLRHTDAYRLRDAGSTATLTFQSWKPAGFYRQDFHLEYKVVDNVWQVPTLAPLR